MELVLVPDYFTMSGSFEGVIDTESCDEEPG